MTNPYQRALRLTATSVFVMAAGTALAAAAAPEQISIPGERIFPESLSSAPDGSVFIGSIGQKMIFRARPGSDTAEPWIQPGTDGILSTFGVLADPKSNTLWVCSASPFGPPGTTPPPSALYAFDLKSGAPKGHYVFPTAGAFCNDVSIAPDGTAYATDAANMEIVRLKRGAKQLEVWAGNGDFGPKGGLLDGITVLGKRVVANVFATSKLFSVPIESDGSAGKVVEVALDHPISRPDGMRPFGRDGVLIIEGGNGGQLSRISLSGDSGKVVLVKQGYPDGPVAVTVVGTKAYVLEGQLAVMFGRPGPDGTVPTPKPFRATAVEVGKP
jgi:sugar lactone lactonase YvrE